MHTLGKVMLGLVMVAAIGTVVLSAKLLEERNKWVRQVEDVKSKNEQSAKDLVAKREELRRLRLDYAQTMLLWDKAFDPVNVPTVTAADGTVQAEVGSGSQLGVPAGPDPPLVHLFMPGAEGPSYLGPFQATTIRPDQSVFKPVWYIRPGETASWKAGGGWRVRTMVPAPYVEHYHQLQNALVQGDELLAAKQKTVQLQTQLFARSEEQRDIRKEELFGFNNPPPNAENLSPEFSKGLVATLEAEEEARNADLATVDRLRRELKEAVQKQQALLARNQRLAASLPGNAAPPAVTKEVSSK